jgi:prophage tail gpP-like protein
VVANTPVIKVNGFELPKWSSVQIGRSVDGLADTIDVQYNLHEQTPAGDVNPLTFDGDEPVVVELDGELLLTGYIDHAESDFAADGTIVQFSGYSRTADLVACPVLPKSIRFTEKSIGHIVGKLCEPFSIEVEVDESASADASTVLATFKAEFGETIHEAICRAVAYRGLLVTPTPAGNVRLARAGSRKATTVLRLGENIKRARVVRDARDRFSHYFVVSDDAGQLGKEGKIAEVRDPGVGRYRPTIVHAEQDARTRADRIAQGEWERNRRVGDSLRISVEFAQWRSAIGVWAANELVRFELNKSGLSIDREMVVATLTLSRDASASTVQLELVHPSSLKPRELPLPRRRKPRAKAAEDFPSAPEVYQWESTGFDQDFVEEFGQDGGIEDWQGAESDPFE